MFLSAHVAKWVVLGSFSPYLYSRILLSHLFRVKWILLTLTLGSRDYFSRRAPPPTDDRRIHQKIQKILSDEFSSIDFREFNRPAQTSFRTWAGSRWINPWLMADHFHSTYSPFDRSVASDHSSWRSNSLWIQSSVNQMLLSSDDFAFFLLLDEYRYSPQILCGPPDPLVDYYPVDCAWLLPCGD